eukprot:Trichotokara_eunicae@DN5280_c0_g1_i1.p1
MGCFECAVCEGSVTFVHFGKTPRSEEGKIVYLEEVYYLPNPYEVEDKNAVLGFEDVHKFEDLKRKKLGFNSAVVGGKCSVCNVSVCLSDYCSFFYVRRYCRGCVTKHSEKFPSYLTVYLEQMINKTPHPLKIENE